jgi:protein-S-isoprenylcysteine O-methyltransferase Ste14
MSEDNGRRADSRQNGEQPARWWWLGQLVLTGIACFFVFFGISLLAASYRLGDPFSFIMTFFAACLIILISAVMVLGFVVRMRRVMFIDRYRKDHEEE